jgi:hypothetical protein
MEIDITILALFMGFAFGLIGVGYLLRFQIPISLFVFIAGGIMASLFIMIDVVNVGYSSNSSIETINHYDVQSSTGQVNINTVNGHTRAERLQNTDSPLLGDTIDCITVFLGRTANAPLTDLVRVGVMDSNTNFVRLFGSMNVTQMTTQSNRPYEFCLPLGDSYTFIDNEAVGIKYNAGDATNTISTRIDANNPFAGTTTEHVHATGSSWIVNTGQDVMMVMTLRGESGVVNAIPFEFTEEIKVFMVLMSVILFLAGAMVEFNTRRS